MNKQHAVGAVAGALTMLFLGVGALTFAQGNTTPGTAPAGRGQGVGGTVSAVNGNTITVTGKNGATYTIDAGSATITKDMTVGVSEVKVGDTVMAQGSLNGTTLTATNVHDGVPPMGGFGDHGRGFGSRGIHGTVSGINGTTLMVTATNPKDNSTLTYTVDASQAQVLASTGQGKPTQSTFSSVKTGDTVMVAGKVNGSTVTAKAIIDGPLPHWGKRLGQPQAAGTATQ